MSGWTWTLPVNDWPVGKQPGDLTAQQALRAVAGPGVTQDVMDAPMYSDNQLRAAVARERERVYAEVRQLAVDHGACYFAEPRPCTCKPDCGTVTRERLPFADVIPEA